MLKPDRRSFVILMTACSVYGQPALADSAKTKAPATKPPASTSAQTGSQSHATGAQAPQLSQEAVGTAPTLGEVLEQEAQQNQAFQNSQINGSVNAPNNAPAAPGVPHGGTPYSGQNGVSGTSYSGQNGVPNGAPGYSGNAPAGYPAAGMRSSINGLLNDIRGMVQNMVQVEPGQENVKVRVPFVNVDVNHGQPNVRVNAPFVKVNKTNGGPVSVDAPFVNVAPQNQPAP